MKHKKITQSDINLFHTDRSGKNDHVIIEGLHAFKHAWRFGAEFDAIYICNAEETLQRMKTFGGKGEAETLEFNASIISDEDFERLAPHAQRTGIVARAKKGASSAPKISQEGYIIVLENPRDVDNVGAVIRACAARGVAGVITTGDMNPWHVNALRGSAGLHFAQPVLTLPTLENLDELFPDRKIIACSDEGEDMYNAIVPNNSILIFGTEREGITQDTKMLSDKIVGIPMQDGVSSMNLATSVSAFIFGI